MFYQQILRLLNPIRIERAKFINSLVDLVNRGLSLFLFDIKNFEFNS